MQHVIETKALTKVFSSGQGIREVDLCVREGEMMGFLGPNGAGKTTTIRILLDFIRPDSGQASMLGMDCHAASLRIREALGYLPGELHLEETLSGHEWLDYLARYRRNVEPSYRRSLVERLDIALDRPIRTYSKGMKQKLGIIQALMHQPRLLILDEPTEGLDPLIQHTFFSLLSEARQGGTTILMSSHVLSEVERTCDRVALIRDGHLLVIEEVETLLARAYRKVTVTFEDDVPQELLLVKGAEILSHEGRSVSLKVTGEIDPLIKRLSEFRVRDLYAARATLEEIFMRYYQKELLP